MLLGKNHGVTSQISHSDLAERLRDMPETDRAITWVMRTNYFTCWSIDMIRDWLGEYGLDHQMPVEEHSVRVALVTSEGVVMAGEDDSDIPLAFFNARCEWYMDPLSCARKTLWDAVRFSTVSIQKLKEETKDVKDEKTGNTIRHVTHVYIQSVKCSKDDFDFCNDDLVWVTDPQDPRVTDEDREFLKILLKCYYKPLQKKT